MKSVAGLAAGVGVGVGVSVGYGVGVGYGYPAGVPYAVPAETVMVPVIPPQANPSETHHAAIWLFLFSDFEGEQCRAIQKVVDWILDRAAVVQKKGKVTELLPAFGDSATPSVIGW